MVLVPSVEIVKADQLAINVRSYLGFAGALSVYSTDSTVYVNGSDTIYRLLDYTTLDTQILVLNGEVFIMRDGQWTN